MGVLLGSGFRQTSLTKSPCAGCILRFNSLPYKKVTYASGLALGECRQRVTGPRLRRCSTQARARHARDARLPPLGGHRLCGASSARPASAAAATRVSGGGRSVWHRRALGPAGRDDATCLPGLRKRSDARSLPQPVHCTHSWRIGHACVPSAGRARAVGRRLVWRIGTAGLRSRTVRAHGDPARTAQQINMSNSVAHDTVRALGNYGRVHVVDVRVHRSHKLAAASRLTAYRARRSWASRAARSPAGSSGAFRAVSSGRRS